MSETQVPEQSFSATDRPGHRLAEARKAAGLSMEEVAAHLRLNVATLQALENDDYSRLPPAAYVSGYLRSYARVLGLSEAEVTRGSAPAPAAEPPIVGVVARSQTAQVQANDPRVRLVTYVVIGGLFLLSSLWWLAQREENAPPVEETVVVEQETQAPVVVDPAAVPAPITEVAGAPAGTVAAVTPVAPAAVTPVPAPVATAPVAPTPAPVVETPPKPEVPPPPPLTPDMPQSKITMEFTADCWVDVVDAAGRQLAYDLSTAGRTLTVRGEAPFKVFFGYSPGVQIYFNDQLFDHRPFQRRETARFKLGTAEDNVLLTEAQ